MMADPLLATREIDLHGLSIDELKALCDQAQKRISELEAAEREEAFRKLDEAAARLGLTKAEIRARYGPRRKRKPRAPKYRNPDNPAETWSGTGRKPAWVEAHLSRGGKLAALKILPQAR